MKNEEHILKERARLTAQKHAKNILSEDSLSVIEFLLFPERYAIESAYVREVLKITEVTDIPGTPNYIVGVVNYRGSIVSVINMKDLLGLKEKGLTEMNKILLLSNGNMEFGLIADGIFGLYEIQLDQVSEPPLNISASGSAFIRGVLENGSILLDGAQLLDNESLSINQ